MRKTNFQWWIQRLQHQEKFFNRLRINHFSAFETAWAIPFEAEISAYGQWIKGPGKALFDMMAEKVSIPLIADDIGLISDAANALREGLGVPFVSVLQAAFTGGAKNPDLPHNHTQNSVVYTGTQKTNTSLGWFEDLEPEERHQVCDYLNIDDDQMPWALINCALASVARLCIIPMQDFLSLGVESRLYNPDMKRNNWQWRFEWDEVPSDLDARLLPVIQRYGRISLGV